MALLYSTAPQVALKFIVALVATNWHFSCFVFTYYKNVTQRIKFEKWTVTINKLFAARRSNASAVLGDIIMICMQGQEKMTGQDRKSHKTVIFHVCVWKDAPWNDVKFSTKIWIESEVCNVITCVKFQSNICRGYDFTEGRIFHFLIDFWMGLTTVQCECALLWNNDL